VGLLYLGHALLGLVATGEATNLALNRNAYQSSTYSEIGGDASRAVDGLADGDYSHNSCTHTYSDAPAWWTVDLGQVTAVGRVRITNRDAFPERLSGLVIALTNITTWAPAPSTGDIVASLSVCKISGQIIGQTSDDYPPAGVPTDFLCDPDTKPGSYLFIGLNVPNFLTLCEVEAYYN